MIVTGIDGAFILDFGSLYPKFDEILEICIFWNFIDICEGIFATNTYLSMTINNFFSNSDELFMEKISPLNISYFGEIPPQK